VDETLPGTIANLLKIEQEGDTLVVTPVTNLRELAFHEIEAGAKEVLELLERRHVRNVVLDFQNTDYYGSTALAFFVKLWKRISSHNGRLAFCNISDDEREVLRATKLDELWPLCRSREEAIALVKADSPPPPAQGP
jgi:anti-anti-sigma factor